MPDAEINPIPDAVPAAAAPESPWSPLKIRIFRYIWLANLVSMIGTWMNDVGAGWLMATLTDSPLMVAMIQTVGFLPSVFLALPAGALADIFDRRRYLIIVNIWMVLVAGLLGILTIYQITDAWLLLGFTFALGIGSAVMMPAFAAVTPEVVPRKALGHAIALNTMGMNVSRAIGPALAGIIVAKAGSGAVFLLNAVSFMCIIIVLWRWQRVTTPSNLPAERFFSALKVGIRFSLNSPPLHAALIRSMGFFVFASALWALLPLIAKQLLQGGPQTFGIMLGCIGIGAVFGALVLPGLRAKYSSDTLVSWYSVQYGVAMAAIALVHNFAVALIAAGVCGMAWITVISSTQVAAQMALPNWVRSRGLAVMVMTMMGSMSGGALIWGKVAEQTSISTALLIAACLTVGAIVLTRRWPISGNDQMDLTPSMHWHMPNVREQISHNRSPVMIIIHYQVIPANQQEFLHTIERLGMVRRRDGAYAWDVMEDAVEPNHYIEYYMVESWLEHLRQRERITNTDKAIQEHLRTLLVDGNYPVVTHFVGPQA
jgi:MFS family permease